MERQIGSGKIKRFMLVFLGSLFVQIFCWAAYSYLKLSIWFCALSAVITALLYHFVQKEEQTGISRRSVFFAAILTPFLLSTAVTVVQLVKYPQLSLLSASLDGVSPMTELTSLYAARLMLNGIVLLLFAAADKAFLAEKGEKHGARDKAPEG